MISLVFSELAHASLLHSPEEIRERVRELLVLTGVDKRSDAMLNQFSGELTKTQDALEGFEKFFYLAPTDEGSKQITRYLHSTFKAEAELAIRNANYPFQELSQLTLTMRKVSANSSNAELKELKKSLEGIARTRFIEGMIQNPAWFDHLEETEFMTVVNENELFLKVNNGNWEETINTWGKLNRSSPDGLVGRVFRNYQMSMVSSPDQNLKQAKYVLKNFATQGRPAAYLLGDEPNFVAKLHAGIGKLKPSEQEWFMGHAEVFSKSSQLKMKIWDLKLNSEFERALLEQTKTLTPPEPLSKAIGPYLKKISFEKGVQDPLNRVLLDLAEFQIKTSTDTVIRPIGETAYRFVMKHRPHLLTRNGELFRVEEDFVGAHCYQVFESKLKRILKMDAPEAGYEFKLGEDAIYHHVN